MELDPIRAVIYVTEKDYASLDPGQSVTLTTDAFPGEVFTGTVARVSPVFRQTSRQARVELTIANSQRRLKPGMFVRVEAILDRADNAVIVPLAALTKRDNRDVIFLASGNGTEAILKPVTVGIRDGERVQVIGEGISGRVITLGQQLVGDGSAITIPDGNDAQTAGGPS